MNRTTRYMLIASVVVIGGLAALASFILWLIGWGTTVGYLAIIAHGWPDPLTWSGLIGQAILFVTMFAGGIAMGGGLWWLAEEVWYEHNRQLATQ